MCRSEKLFCAAGGACVQVLTDIYQSLFKLQENTELAKSEVLLGSWGAGHLVFIPGGLKRRRAIVCL